MILLGYSGENSSMDKVSAVQSDAPYSTAVPKAKSASRPQRVQDISSASMGPSHSQLGTLKSVYRLQIMQFYFVIISEVLLIFVRIHCVPFEGG